MTNQADGMRKQLDAIWERSRKEIEGRVETIESAAIALLDGSLDADTRATALREAHKISGVAGTFGFSQSTALAREAEGILRNDHEITAADVLRLSAIANELRVELIERGRVSADAGAASPDQIGRASCRERGAI